MRKSLSVKMFTTIFISFLSVITITVSLLFIYFQFFYEDEKIGRVIDSMNEFSYEYLKEEWNEPQLYQKIANFSNVNGLEFNVFDYETMTGSYETSIYMDMEEQVSKDNESYYYITTVNQDSYYEFMLTSPEYDTLKSFNSFNNSDGIEIQGYIDDYNFVIAERINGMGIQSTISYVKDHDMKGFKTFEGTVVILSAQEIFDIDVNAIQDKSIMIENNGMISNVEIKDSDVIDQEASESVIADEIQDEIVYQTPLVDESFFTPDVVLESFNLEDYNFETKEKDNITYTISHIPYTDYDQVSFSKIVTQDGRDIEFYGFLSMQPVGEIIEMITHLIPYFLLGSFVLALFIAYFYSKTVAAPIVEITKVADKMAGMDLTICAPVNREDELGNLAKSLNTLASNLRESMDELVMKNKQLAYDVELKVMQEEARKAFVANASHELKTPLGVIKSYTEAIKDGIKLEKKDYYMSVIMDEIAHMDKLIHEMLMLSKFDAGAVKYNYKTIDMDLLMHNTKEAFQKEVQHKQMTIEIKSPLGLAIGDKEKIYQVMTNLLSNAIKYGKENTNIRIESISKSKKIEFYFYNECDNIPEDSLVKIWDRFYKVDVSHNKKIEGNGLGLAIVKSILEGHKAEYGVYNTMKGICFYFCLMKE